jgi:chlorite dismutase
MLWASSPGLADIHDFHVVLAQSGLMGWAETPYSYLAMTKESEYSEEERLEIRASQARYLFVYPFWKRREWYRLPAPERKRIMDEHIEIGRRYPTISINTTYSFGLDDQEFVVSFETDEPADFLDLVHELRSSESSSYTLRDTPIFTCIQTSVRRALDALDGEAVVLARFEGELAPEGAPPLA